MSVLSFLLIAVMSEWMTSVFDLTIFQENTEIGVFM